MAANPVCFIDVPAAGSSNIQAFFLGGWAIDLGAGAGTGVDGVQVWAYPPIGAPTFIGGAAYGNPRPDVAAAYGGQFLNSGWTQTVGLGVLPIGAYTFYAFPHSTVLSAYGPPFVISLIVTVARPAPITIASPALNWFLHRCDVRPRGEQTSQYMPDSNARITPLQWTDGAWDDVKGYIKQDLEQIALAFNQLAADDDSLVTSLYIDANGRATDNVQIQRGTATIANGQSSVAVTFNQAYTSTARMTVQLTPGSVVEVLAYSSLSLTGFTVRRAGSTGAHTFSWLAFGLTGGG